MIVSRGRDVPVYPRMTVIVMATNSDPMSIEAIGSVVAPEIEKILVNTGAGSLKSFIHGDDIVLVESETLRLPGGTRNLGIEQSSAPIISFLAADCLADHVSLEKRISAHQSGFDLVSSTLRPFSDTLASWASYIYVHKRRMPEFQKGAGSFFGVSYNASVFDEVGYFDEDMRISEDAEFNDRCAHLAKLTSKDIITLHKYPDTIAEAMKDAKKRAIRDMHHRGRSKMKQAVSEIAKSIRLSLQVLSARSSHNRARFAALLLPLLGFSAAIGCLASTKKRP